MPEGRDFLDRFRPAGAPGSAARAGVPADRARELADELGPVLSQLDDTHAECERIAADAGRQAERILAAARSEAERIAAEADARARAAREEATRRVLARAGEQTEEATQTAGEQARLARERAARRLPELVARAVGLVRAGVPDPEAEPAGEDRGGAAGRGGLS